ncbi:ash family protein, partial [Escherichia coli]|uniref:ash family protein n=1 Tax=Escherichia coli TaxID=562 RepID=UPI003EE04BEF
SMVAQAGQPPGWPVSCEAGISTPVWAIAIERGNSGDSVICYSQEAAIMATAYFHERRSLNNFHRDRVIT